LTNKNDVVARKFKINSLSKSQVGCDDFKSLMMKQQQLTVLLIAIITADSYQGKRWPLPPPACRKVWHYNILSYHIISRLKKSKNFVRS